MTDQQRAAEAERVTVFIIAALFQAAKLASPKVTPVLSFHQEISRSFADAQAFCEEAKALGTMPDFEK